MFDRNELMNIHGLLRTARIEGLESALVLVKLAQKVETLIQELDRQAAAQQQGK